MCCPGALPILVDPGCQVSAVSAGGQKDYSTGKLRDFLTGTDSFSTKAKRATKFWKSGLGAFQWNHALMRQDTCHIMSRYVYADVKCWRLIHLILDVKGLSNSLGTIPLPFMLGARMTAEAGKQHRNELIVAPTFISS